jgi:hypothetical protein
MWIQYIYCLNCNRSVYPQIRAETEDGSAAAGRPHRSRGRERCSRLPDAGRPSRTAVLARMAEETELLPSPGRPPRAAFLAWTAEETELPPAGDIDSLLSSAGEVESEVSLAVAPAPWPGGSTGSAATAASTTSRRPGGAAPMPGRMRATRGGSQRQQVLLQRDHHRTTSRPANIVLSLPEYGTSKVQLQNFILTFCYFVQPLHVLNSHYIWFQL